jgi:arsenate reductase-like glutaredoxin family protein
MSKYALTIAYDGSALQNGSMDVKELAPALLAFGSLLDEVNKELNGSESKLQVLVKSDFKTGSFHVDFEIARTLMEQVGLFLGNIPSFSVEQILNHIGLVSTISGITLLELFRKIAGRKIKKGTVIEDNNIKLEFEDNSQSISVNKNIYQLFINLNVQTAVQKVLKPLERDGIDRFFSQKDGKVEREISKSELPYYRTPEVSKKSSDDEKILESTSKVAFKIITASFEEGYKWRLTNGQDKITAAINDQSFISRIDNNEVSISKSDTLIVEMKTTQWQSQNGSIKTENEIIEVLEHRKSPNQLAIPFYEDEK